MPTPYTPPAVPQFLPIGGMITGPADADPLLASSVNDAFFPLADRSQISFLGLYGVAGSRLVASCTDGINLTLNVQQAVRSTTRILAGNLGSPLSIATVLGSSPVASTWYYLYAADVSGVLTPIISTDPPEATLKYRTGNFDQVLITMFRTDSSATVRPFSHYQNKYLYLNPFSILSGAVSPTVITVNVPDVPPVAKMASIGTLVTNTSTSVKPEFQIRGSGASSGNFLSAGLSPDGTTEIDAYLDIDIPMTSSVFVYQAILIDTGRSTLNVTLDGFYL